MGANIEQASMKNFIQESVEAYKKHVLESYENAKKGFSVIHVLIGIAIIDGQDAIDAIDDAGLRSFTAKKCLVAYERRVKHYETFMRSHMTDKSWYLLQDYSNMAYKRIEDKVSALREACERYLDKHGESISAVLAKCETTFLLWKVAIDSFRAYFAKYEDICRVNFSRDFSYADMSAAFLRWGELVDALAVKSRGIDFGDDEDCVNCWLSLESVLNDEDFLNGSANDALVANKQNYAEELASIQ